MDFCNLACGGVFWCLLGDRVMGIVGFCSPRWRK